MSYVTERRKVHNTGGFDDNESRKVAIEFFKEVYNFDLISNPISKKIDLVARDRSFGVEIERMKKDVINFWYKINSGRNMLSGMGYPTVNMPWWRKWKYWNKGLDPNWNKNIYARVTSDYLCMIVVPPEVILDDTKAIDKKFRAYDTTTGDLEDWKVFRREDVLTYVRETINSPWRLYGIDEVEPK